MKKTKTNTNTNKTTKKKTKRKTCSMSIADHNVEREGDCVALLSGFITFLPDPPATVLFCWRSLSSISSLQKLNNFLFHRTQGYLGPFYGSGNQSLSLNWCHSDWWQYQPNTNWCDDTNRAFQNNMWQIHSLWHNSSLGVNIWICHASGNVLMNIVFFLISTPSYNTLWFWIWW